MAENKGKPSGGVAETKKDAGRHGDIKRIGRIAGARKNQPSRSMGVRGVAGTESGRKRERS